MDYELKTKEQLKEDYIALVKEMNKPDMTSDLDAISEHMHVMCAKVGIWKTNVAIFVCNGLNKKAEDLTRKWFFTDQKKAIDLYREYIDKNPIEIKEFNAK